MDRPEGPWEELDFDVDSYSGRYYRLAVRKTGREAFYYLSGNIAGGLTEGVGARVKTGVEHTVEEQELPTYLNPVLAGRISIMSHASGMSRAHLTISQSHGKQMVSREVKLPAKLETTGWIPGVYFIKVVSNMGSVTRPLVVH